MLEYADDEEEDCVVVEILESLPQEDKVNLPAKLRRKLIESYMKRNEIRSATFVNEACKVLTQLVMGRMGPFDHFEGRAALQYCVQNIPLPGYPEKPSLFSEGIARTDNFQYPDNPLPLETTLEPIYRGKSNYCLRNAIRWVEVPSLDLRGFYKVRRTSSDIANEFSKKKRKFKKVVKIDKWIPSRQSSLVRPSEEASEEALLSSKDGRIQFGKIEIFESPSEDSFLSTDSSNESVDIPRMSSILKTYPDRSNRGEDKFLPIDSDKESLNVPKFRSILKTSPERTNRLEDKQCTDEIWEDILPPRDFKAVMEEPVPESKLWVAQPFNRKILPRAIIVAMNDEIPTCSQVALATWGTAEDSSEEEVDVTVKQSCDRTSSPRWLSSKHLPSFQGKSDQNKKGNGMKIPGILKKKM